MYDPAKRRRDKYRTDPEFKKRALKMAKSWYERNKNKPEFKKHKKAYQKKNAKRLAKVQKENNKQHPFAYSLRRLKLRAKQNNIIFDLDEQYLKSIWTGKCAIFGTTLSIPYSTDRNDPTKATVDKIIPDLGYIKGNVQWVSNKANIIKSFGTLEEHQAVVKYIKRHTEKSNKHQQDQKVQLFV